MDGPIALQGLPPRTRPCAGKANVLVAENLYCRATGEGREAVAAAIFWLKTRASPKETNLHELTGPPSKIEISWIDSKL